MWVFTQDCYIGCIYNIGCEESGFYIFCNAELDGVLVHVYNNGRGGTFFYSQAFLFHYKNC